MRTTIILLTVTCIGASVGMLLGVPVHLAFFLALLGAIGSELFDRYVTSR